MPSVDNRVVEMRFDNKEFESGVGTSLNTIEKLKKSLNFKGAADGFNEIEAASKKVDFSSLSNAVDSISQHFSAFGLIGDQVLRRIGDSIYDLEMRAVNLVKSLTVDNIEVGWTKYNDKIASIQTIMNSTGLSIDEVNERLDRLMWYSDETSFGFNDMTSALQVMTASGGDLDELIPVMMGVGNAVAYAGKGASEFSRVMQYAVAQAYQKGTLLSQDWRTLTAIDSMPLRQAFIDAAKEVGTLDESATVADFSDAMSGKKFTKEVMEKAFAKFAERTLEAEKLINEGVYDTATEAYRALSEQYDDFAMKAARSAQETKTFAEVIEYTKDAVSSGWSESFEKIIGNFVEAKELWSWLSEEFYEVFVSGGEERNKLLDAWHNLIFEDVNGYAMAVESFKNIWYSLKDIILTVKDAISDVFPPTTVGHLVTVTMKLRDATRAIRDFFTYDPENAEETSDAILTLQSIIRGIAAAIDIVKQAAEALWSVVIKPLLKDIGKLLYPVFKWLGEIGDKIFDLDKMLKKNQTFKTILKGIVDSLKSLKDQFDIFIGKVKELESFKNLVERLRAFKETIDSIKSEIFERVLNTLSSISGVKFDGLQSAFDVLLIGVDWVLTKLNSLFDLIETNGPKITEFFKSLDFSSISGFFSSAGQSIGEFISNAVSSIDITKITAKASEIFGGIWNSLIGFIKNLDMGQIGAAIKEALGIAGDAGFVALLIGIVRGIFGLGDLAASGASVLDGVTEVLTGFAKSLNGFSRMLNATAFLEAAAALVAVAGAMWILSKIPADQLGDIAVALGAVAMALGFLVNGLAKIHNKTAPVIKGFTAFSNTMSVFPKSAAYVIIAAAGAILMLINALKQIIDIFKTVDADTLNSSFWTLGIMVAGITGMAILLSKFAGNLDFGSALAFVGFAASILLVVQALKNIVDANLDTKDLIVAGSVIAGIMLFFGIVGALTKSHSSYNGASDPHLLEVAVSFVAVMAAINFLLVPAIKKLSEIDKTMLITAGAVIAGIFAIFSTAAILMEFKGISTDTIKTMLVIALDIAAIGAALAVLGQLNLGQAAIAVGSIVLILAAFTGMAAAAGFVPQLATGFKLLTSALIPFGATILMVGVGVLAFAAALAILSDSSINCAEAGKNLAEGIIEFLKVINENAPVILETVMLILSAILLAIAAHKAQLATTIISTISSVITTLAGWLNGAGAGQILLVLALVLGIILSFISGAIGPLASALFAAVVKLINALSIAILDNGQYIWNAVGNLCESLFIFLARGAVYLVDKLFDFFKTLPLIGPIFTQFEDELKTGFDGIISELDEESGRLKGEIQKDQEGLTGIINEGKTTIVDGVKGYFGSFGRAVDEEGEILYAKIDNSRRRAHKGLTEEIHGTPKVTLDSAEVDSSGATNAINTEIQNIETTTSETPIEVDPNVDLGVENVDTTGFMGGIFDNLLSGSQKFDFGGIGSGLGFDFNSGLLSGVTDNLNLGEEAGVSLGNTLSGALAETLGINSPSTVAQEQGTWYVIGLSNALMDPKNLALFDQSISKLKNKIETELKPLYDMFYNVGVQADKGLAQGMRDYQHVVGNASRSIARLAYETAEKELGIASPSKVMKKEGMWAALGLVEGIEDYSYAVDDAVVHMTAGAKKEAALFWADVSSIIDDEPNLDVEIGVTPVVDWNNVDEGLAKLAEYKYVRDINGRDVINGAWYEKNKEHYQKYGKYLDPRDDPNFNIGPKNGSHLWMQNMSLNVKTLEEFTKKMTSNDAAYMASGAATAYNGSHSGYSSSGSGYDDTKLLAKIDKLDDRVSSLGYAVGRLQVVLDTGALVGAITPAVDEALGDRVAMIERGA